MTTRRNAVERALAAISQLEADGSPTAAAALLLLSTSAQIASQRALECGGLAPLALPEAWAELDGLDGNDGSAREMAALLVQAASQRSPELLDAVRYENELTEAALVLQRLLVAQVPRAPGKAGPMRNFRQSPTGGPNEGSRP